MPIAGIKNFNLISFGNIPKAKVYVPKQPEKKPTVHQSAIPYPYKRPTAEEIMQNHERMQKMFEEMFSDVRKLELTTYELYSIDGKKHEMQIDKRLVNMDERNFSRFELRI